MKAHKRLRRARVAPERPRLSLPLPPPEPPQKEHLDVPEDETERGVADVNFFI
jgi:hypothetical protein